MLDLWNPELYEFSGSDHYYRFHIQYRFSTCSQVNNSSVSQQAHFTVHFFQCEDTIFYVELYFFSVIL